MRASVRRTSVLLLVITFSDLAGHTRYVRTTLFGLSAHAADFAMLCVDAPSSVGTLTSHVGLTGLSLKRLAFSRYNPRTLLVRDHPRRSGLRGDQQNRSLLEDQYSANHRLFDVSSETWQWIHSTRSVRGDQGRGSSQGSEHVRGQKHLPDLCRLVRHR